MVRFIIVSLVFVTSFVYGQNNLLVDSSSISFQIKNAGITVNGTFTGLAAEIDFNPKKLNSSLIVASVDASSVDTGIRIRNKHLRTSDFFHVDAYPQITMRSRNFQRKGEEQFLGIFTIHLKGKEDHVSFPFSFEKEEAYFIFKGSFEINRNDFDIGDASILLDDMVQVTIWVKAREENRRH
jgi:polyisoprenoid-binding protein YceI